MKHPMDSTVVICGVSSGGRGSRVAGKPILMMEIEAVKVTTRNGDLSMKDEGF